ncbi:MAG: cation:proton antiporter [Gemmatimonadota bacterium]|nr:cation:proton antiporter [Gemmatimonadota bacterium]
MSEVSVMTLTIGAVLLLGLVADALASRTPLPRVTVLMLLGVLAGPTGFDLLPPGQETWFTVTADIALVMIGFLLGSEFTRKHVQELEAVVFRIAIMQSVITAAMVGGGLLVVGVPPEIALPLGGIATATAPAATLAVVKESGARGRFVDVLKGVVAVDDIMGIVLFTVLVAGSGILTGDGTHADALVEGIREIAGSILLGLAIGLPASRLTGRIRPGEATLEEALGLVLLCAGLAGWLDVPPILTAIVMGASLANLAHHHERAFHEIERIEWPFLVVFFVLAGASLEVRVLESVGWLAAGYVILRIAGKLLGAALGARWASIDGVIARWLGLALLPQAGVALGLALAASLRFPEAGTTVLNVVVAATVLFELAGPLLTRLALQRTGTIKQP